MRRKDREVTDNYEINKIINSCQIIRLAFADGVAPYIVPLNFGFEEKDVKRTFYFHGAKEGRKLDLIKKLVAKRNQILKQLDHTENLNDNEIRSIEDELNDIILKLARIK